MPPRWSHGHRARRATVKQAARAGRKRSSAVKTSQRIAVWRTDCRRWTSANQNPPSGYKAARNKRRIGGNHVVPPWFELVPEVGLSKTRQPPQGEELVRLWTSLWLPKDARRWLDSLTRRGNLRLRHDLGDIRATRMLRPPRAAGGCRRWRGSGQPGPATGRRPDVLRQIGRAHV